MNRIKHILISVAALVTAMPATLAQIPVPGQRGVFRRPVSEKEIEANPIRIDGTKADGITDFKALVILAEFSDVSYTFSTAQFENMLISKDKSAVQYLKEQLGVNVEVTVAGPVKVPNTRTYYGEQADKAHDIRPGEFIADACIAADAIVDFTKFDQNHDGKVDNVFVFYAGEDEAQQPRNVNTNFLWSHAWTLKSSDYGKELQLDGVSINNYACSSELFCEYTSATEYRNLIAPIGTFCHEYLHTLGLYDLYDTDNELSGGIAAGVWFRTDIMDMGNYNNDGNTPPNLNAVNRQLLGLSMPEELKPGSYAVKPLGSEGAKIYSITNPAEPAEYYLFEARSNDGWDKYIGGKGLLVYHVDKSEKYKSLSDRYQITLTSQQRWFPYNEVNCRPDNQCADLVEADGRKDADPSDESIKDISGVFFPQNGAYNIGGSATVKMPFRDGTFPSLYLTDIEIDTDGSVKFVVKDGKDPTPPDPVDPAKDEDMIYIIITEKSGILSLKLSNSLGAESIKWTCDGKEVLPVGLPRPDKGVIGAEVKWADGSTDQYFKNIR